METNAPKTDETLLAVMRETLDARCGDLLRAGRAVRVWGDRDVILSYSTKSDTRRNTDPLEFTKSSMFCPCVSSAKLNGEGLSGYPERHQVALEDLSESSVVLFNKKQSKVMLFAKECGPEPRRSHFRDMLALTSRLGPGYLTAVNLPGSGASVPQHFHAQFLSLAYLSGGKRHEDSVDGLLKKARTSGDAKTLPCGVAIFEVTWPVWGVILDFTLARRAPWEVADLLYHAVHEKVRYRSQLALSYNLYVRSENWQQAMVLFRETRLERVCDTPETTAALSKRLPRSRVEDISSSMNNRWRWGWMEALGGLMARDDCLDDDLLDLGFWQEVYSRITLREEVQNRVHALLKGGLYESHSATRR